MQNILDKETIRALALANGLTLPEDRLEIVLKQYENYLQLFARLDSWALEMAAEPATTFTLVPDAPGPAQRQATR